MPLGYATSFFLALCLLIKKQFFYIPYVSRKQESLIWLQAKKGGKTWKENCFTRR